MAPDYHATYLLPLAEAQRLKALQPYQLLNTMRDETFAELVRLVAKLFRVPVSIVAFVEAEEVRFGLNYGLGHDLDRVNRWETLCSVAMLREHPSVFENLHDQPCDLINPALVQQLHLGFYAGTALRTAAGFPIGVLCVIDHKARSFSPAEAALLERLAAVVMSLLDLRLQLARQPTWNQKLWERVYRRIEASLARLEALAEPAAPLRQAAVREEGSRIIAMLAEQIQAFQS